MHHLWTSHDQSTHNILWKNLSRLGMSKKSIRILAFLYSHTSMLIRNSSGLSESIDIIEGVSQGEVLSPILFALFLADLEDFLKRRRISRIELSNAVRILLFADADASVFMSLLTNEMNTIL